jgi:hypothetical protein
VQVVDPEAMMLRDLRVFESYFELLIRVIMPRIFPVYTAVCGSAHTRQQNPRALKQTKTVNAKLNLLEEISSALRSELPLLFQTISSIMQQIQGILSEKALFIKLNRLCSDELMEDQMNRVCTLLKSMYVWDLLNEISRFRPSRLEGDDLILMTNVMSAQSARGSGVRGKARKQPRGRQFSGGKGDGLTTLEGLGENWRMLLDALSLRPSSKKFFSFVDVKFRREIGYERPSTASASAATAIEESVVTLEPALPKGKYAKRNQKGRKRGGGSTAEFKMCATALNFLVFADDQKQEYQVPIPPRFVEVLKASIDGEAISYLFSYSHFGNRIPGASRGKCGRSYVSE